MSEFDFSKLTVKNASSNFDVASLVEKIKKTNTKNLVVQIFDPASLISRLHVEGAYANSIVAFKNKTNRTKSIAMEMLLFTAFTDQIEQAIERSGAKESSNFIL